MGGGRRGRSHTRSRGTPAPCRAPCHPCRCPTPRPLVVPSGEASPHDSPVRPPDGALAFGPHSRGRTPSRRIPYRKPNRLFSAFGVHTSTGSVGAPGRSTGWVRAGGPAGPGRLVGRSHLGPFLLCSSAVAVGPPPARRCVPELGPGRRPARSPWGQAPSLQGRPLRVPSRQEALSVKPIVSGAGWGRWSPSAASLLESVLKLPCDARPRGISQKPHPRPGR